MKRKAIRDAVERSQSHTETVSLDFAGSVQDLLYSIGMIVGDGIDDATENNGRVDVWGWDDTTPEGQQKWRLRVKLI